MERIRQFDALRGLAALAVVLFHYIVQYPRLFDLPPTGLAPVFKYGGYGVDLFFMISGFVITMALQQAAGMRAFVAARFVRLYPAYWVAVTVTFIICDLASLEKLQVTFKDYVANLTMLQRLLGFEHVDGAYWSLEVEWLFYASIACFFLVPLKRIWIWLAVWLIAAIVTQHLPWQFGAGSRLGQLSGTFLAFRYIHLFILGAAFYLVRQEKRVALTSALLIAGALACQFAAEGADVGILTLGYAAIFYAVVQGRLKWMGENRVLLFLGSISYSLYLIHQHNGYVIINGLTKAGWPYWLSVIIALIAVLVGATLLNQLVEEPAARLYRRRLKLRRELAAKPAVV